MSDRRQANERRTAAEPRRRESRRRAADDRTLIVELGESKLRYATLTREAGAETELLQAGRVNWRKGDVSLHTREGVSQLSAALRDIAKKHEVAGGSLHLLLSGAFCTTRVIRGSNDEVRTELAQLEQRSRLYLALGPGPKSVVSAVKQLDGRKQHGLALICNQATLDVLSESAEAAGLNLSCVEAVLTSMNRALSRVPGLPEEPFLLVHLGERSVEIGVCCRGDLLLDYRPSGAVQMHDVPQLLVEHLSRLRRYAGRQLGGPPADLRKLFVHAAEDAEPEVVAAFSQLNQFEVTRVGAEDVPGTWRLDPTTARLASLASLGGAILRLESQADPTPDMLQHILERTREPLRPILLRAAAPLAAVLLALAGLWGVGLKYQREVSQLQAGVDELAAAQGRANELRLKLIGAEAKLKQMKRLAEQLPGRTGDEAVALIGQCLPDDVWLNRLEMDDLTSVKLQGASFNEAGVYDYVRWLELAPPFVETVLKATNLANSTSGPVTGFDVEVKLAEFATAASEGGKP
ncbi:MAG: PilN domain-containing protein [Planctomycetales bacterium]|nr:PilN domain-containing protein [Planctomycetales bacterium]